MTSKKLTFKISGMTCASCAINNEKALQKHDGIIAANVNFASKKALVEYDADSLSEKDVKKIILDNGYQIESTETDHLTHHHHSKQEANTDEHAHHGENISQKYYQFIGSALLTLPLALEMIVKLRTNILLGGQDLIMWVHLTLATIVVFYFGQDFHRMAFKQARHLRANMDTLVSLGTIAAYIFSLWALFNNQEGYLETAAIIITLILLGRYFEAKSTSKAGQALRKLAELSVKSARVIKNNQEIATPLEQVQLNEILLIKPSEKIPLDGKIIEGASSVDQSMLTGESMPMEKKVGDQVFGGTINRNGILKIRVTQTGENTVLAQIIKTVEEAQGSKAPIQKLADQISGIFVPVVILIAIITFIGWYFSTGQFTISFINSIAVLIIACPCALGLATPTAIMVGTGKGAKSGILFKTGESFERTKNISLVVFDKTGTLTKGQPQVEKIITNPNYRFNEQTILKVAASLAQHSEHPLSQAISAFIKNPADISMRVQSSLGLRSLLDLSSLGVRGGEGGSPEPSNPASRQKSLSSASPITLATLENFQELEGKGLTASCQQHKTAIALGNLKLLQDQRIDSAWAEKTLHDHSAVGTWLFVVHDQKNIGAILIADEIRDEAKDIIASLKKEGLKISMISGDNKKTAQAVGKKLGIDNILAEVLPQEKSARIKELQNQGEKVVFVGDGINDAPSLVQADLGIAMGSATDIAKEAGQIILLQNNLWRVVEAIRLSKITFSTIKQNLFWAFFYNVIAIPLAAFGLLSPAIAAAAMSFSSVSVVLNSLRIYQKK